MTMLEGTASGRKRSGGLCVPAEVRWDTVHMETTLPYKKAAVVSKDGTTIGYRQLGSGPGVLLLHGGMEASQHLLKLATFLSDRFTVSLPDRRGRGMSGPFGEDYSITKECEDVAALVEGTGAERIFGLSPGALITLRSALV